MSAPPFQRTSSPTFSRCRAPILPRTATAPGTSTVRSDSRMPKAKPADTGSSPIPVTRGETCWHLYLEHMLFG
ncbi:hypothetical protein HU200_056041 [Digitaria exilis]|uniref:Uncharacterized protein n=1 Tax=Digitaria exilis TaxID=1010633 RepID=A0A835AFX6_9POAL|nr:hypothetical protein HU200_056041 [Digitaria exilis]